MPTTGSTRHGSGRTLRWGAAALGVTTLIVAIWTGWNDAAARRALSDEAIRLGFGEPQILQRIRFTPDLDLARLATARAALDADLQAIRAARPVSLERLRWAEATAATVRERRPHLFEAASTLALARLLVLQQSRDPRLYTERALWEAPLQEALRRAPHEPEPRTILLRARLALWFSLSAAERAETRALAQRTFEDPGAFDALIPAWYAANDPWTESADEVVPDGARALNAVSYALGGRGEFEAIARLRRRAAMRARSFPFDGEARDERLSESRRLDRLSGTPPSREFAVTGSELLERAAPAALQSIPQGDLAAWWAWSVDEAASGRAGLSRTAAERVALAVRAPDCERALVLLASPSTPIAEASIAEAERLEPPAGSGSLDPCWEEYLVAKAKRLASDGQPAAAEAARELARQVGTGASRGLRLRSNRVSIATSAPEETEVRLVLAHGRHGDPLVIDLAWDGWWQTSLPVPANGVVVARLATRSGEGPSIRQRTLIVTGVVGGRPEPLSLSFNVPSRPAPLR